MKALALALPNDVGERLEFEAGLPLLVPPGSFWRIVEGSVALVGRDRSGQRHPLGVLAVGDVLADVSPLQASAEGRAVLERLSEEGASIAREPLARLVEQLQHRLTERHERALISRFLQSLLALVLLYMALLGAPRLLAVAPDSAWISLPLQALFLFETVRFVRRSGLPRAWFSLTMSRARRSLLEGLALAVLLCGATLAVQRLLPSLLPRSHGGFDSPLVVVGAAAAYALFSFVQEFVVRGGVQPCLRLALGESGPGVRSMLIANALFALMHLHLSWSMVGFSFAVGMVWSALHAHQRNLVGVTVSHAVVGLFALFVLRLG